MDSNWLTIILIVCVVISLTGWLTGRRLPKFEKTRHFRKFHAVATIIFLFYFVLMSPTIVSFSFVSNREYEYPKDLETTEAIAKQTQEQHQRLERLELEVKNLREDLYQAHRHYSFLLIMFFSGALSFLVKSAFFSKKDNLQNDDT